MSDFRMPHDPSTLAAMLIRSLRRAASCIPDFEEGAIAIRFVSKCQAAELWMGGPKTGENEENVDLDFVVPVRPGGRKTRSAGWRDQPECSEMACAGVVMEMLEGCARAVIKDLGRTSDCLPDVWVIPGTSNRKGAICLDIDLPKGHLDASHSPSHSMGHFLRLYIGICGATPDEDHRCVFAAALPTLLEALEGSGAGVVSPPDPFRPDAD